MLCRICELDQRQFYCETCIRTHAHDLSQQTRHFAADRDEHIAKANRALSDFITPIRTSRGVLASFQRRVGEVQLHLAALRKENEKKRDKLRTLRENLASRRRNLSAAKLTLPSMGLGISASMLSGTPPSASSISASPVTGSSHSPAHAQSPLNNPISPIQPIPIPQRETEAMANLSLHIARARSVLVQELVEVFNIVEIGGRPPIGGKAGTKGEWTIGDLVLPVPGDIRRYPPDHINAVMTHTVHFLNLLTFYLGVKLPFEIVWSGGKLGVGQPWIGATGGTETGGWARWYSKHPLHLSASATPLPPKGIAPTPLDAMAESTTTLAGSAIASVPPTSTESNFIIAFAMLLYNVSYLAFTQNVEVPLNGVGFVLSNLWMVCCSSELGRWSHETFPLLPPPTPPSFPLDFQQLLQTITASPAPRPSRGSAVGKKAPVVGRGLITEVTKEEEEGWDFVDDDV